MNVGGVLETFLEGAIQFVPKLIAALFLFVGSLLLSGVVARWVRRVAGKRIADREPCLLLSRLARWSVIITGTLLSLDQVDFDVTGFVAGLGIAGLTVGFALQDIARNFVAGVLLLVRQPIKIGDAVQVQDYAGTVLAINTRDTVIKTWDGETVILPNIDVFGSAIVNYSELPYRRRTVRIGLGYDQDVEQAMHVFLEAVRGVEGVVTDPPATIHAEELGDSTLILAARFWLDQQTHSLFDVHSMAVRAILEAAEKEEIDLPYPIQTVRVEGHLNGL
jgi:small-conductance mechanosensitive channel